MSSRTSRPPPSGPLPALPVYKTRNTTNKSNDALSDTSECRPTSTASQPRNTTVSSATTPKRTALPSRSVTVTGLPTPGKTTKANSTPSIPTLKTTAIDNGPAAAVSGVATPRTIRKTTSIGQFPMPPKGSARVSSLPPSPLSTAQSTSSTENLPVPAVPPKSRQRDGGVTHRASESGLKKPKPRSSGYGLRTKSSNASLKKSASSSVLNATSGSLRNGDSLLSVPSPPVSRPSSMNDSYHNDASLADDDGDEGSGRSRMRRPSAAIKVNRDSDGGKDSKGNVIVSVRVRPDAGREESKPEGEWMVDGRRSLISYRGREGGDYRYDNVFSPNDGNAKVYDNAAKRLVRRVMEGYHGTVFAYGMTGTGKTFSMQGTATQPGVIPLAITDIFSYIRENPSREFLLRVSYLEIYNEKIYDLLTQATPGQVQEEIKLREDSRRGVYATPLKEEIVQSPNQLLRVIARGDQARRTGSTQFNARSSRSHAVVQIVVESRERTQNPGPHFEKEGRRIDRVMPGGVLVSTLSLIDLAGSEKAAEDKERRTEGAHINKSLLTLGTVIARLSTEDEKEKDGAKTGDKEKAMKHLPYRDSKLTRLLQGALSGNSLVSILCTIQLSSANTSAAQASSHTGETLNTLKFASRAKNNIVSNAKKNESLANPGDPNSRALLDRYRIEIQELRAQLAEQNKAKEEAEKAEQIEEDRELEEQLEREEKHRHEEQMLEMQLARTALKERISHLNRLILSSRSIGVNSGRFSSISLPFNPRTSIMSATQSEYGWPPSVKARDSLHRESFTALEGSPTIEIAVTSDSIGTALSSGSVIVGTIPGAQMSQMVEEDTPNLTEDDGDYSGLPDEDGADSASLLQQNRMLQADLADKNRYIATLEKRLLQARRTSHSRVSMAFAGRVGVPEEGSVEAMLRDKDREIDALRAKLDDQTAMVTALRSAARKREMLDHRKSFQTATSEDTARPSTSAADSVADLPNLPMHRNSSRASNRSRVLSNGHRSTSSNASRSSVGAINFSKTPLSPVSILSPSHSLNSSRESNTLQAFVQREQVANRRRSVDEMTQLLDQMIQDKVESGHLVRNGDRDSIRVRHDTVILANGTDATETQDESK